MSGRLENDSFKLLELKLNLEGNMADKIQNAYETSKNIYDDVLTQRNIFSKLYIKLFWSGTDDNDIARKVLAYIPDDFSGNSFACYILFQKERLYIQVRKVIFAFISRQKAEAFLKICSLTYRTFANFLAGQCLEAIILGSMFVVTLSILKMPYALLIGILIAFTALIPIFGAFIGCAVGVFLIFMVSPKQAVLFIIIFLLLQQIEGNLIYPHVVGGSVGLPSIWVLAAVTIGGNLMGIVGMLIFIPTVSVFYTIFREYVYLRLKKQNIKRVTRTEVEEYDKRV